MTPSGGRTEPGRRVRPAGAPDDTIGAVGEFATIDSITADLPSSAGVIVGPGDDAAVVASPDSRVVTSCDTFVERVHFRTDWASGAQIGRKVALASMADIVAMGAVPTALVVALAAPPDTRAQLVTDIAQGIVGAAEEFDAALVGGDLTRADMIVITVTVLGDLRGHAPVLRSGARAGDQVALAGRVGWAAAGLAVLSRGFRSPAAVVGAYQSPNPPLAAGPAAAADAGAMTDVSDGLVADLGHMARASNVVIDIESATLPVPDKLAEVGSALGCDPREWLLGGGEDHALVATFPAGFELSSPWRRIGMVHGATEGAPDTNGVMVDGHPYDAAVGFEHFR